MPALIPLLVAVLGLVATVAGCGGETPESEYDDRPFADLALDELVDWEARPKEPAKLAEVLAEVRRRIRDVDETTLYATVLPALEPVLAHEEEAVRKEAVRAAAQVARRSESEPAVALVAGAVTDEATPVRLAAVRELGALLQRRIASTETVLAGLAHATADRSEAVREQALKMLAAAGTFARGAAGAVVNALQAEDERGLHEQLKAWETLRALKPTDEEIREFVEAAAGTAEEPRIARAATDVLAGLTELDGDQFDVALDALEALLAPLRHGSAEVRLRAIEALEAAGAPAREIAAEPLEDVAANDPQREVRRRAAQARNALGLDDDAENAE